MDYTYDNLGFKINIYKHRRHIYEVSYLIDKNNGRVCFNNDTLKRLYKNRMNDLQSDLEHSFTDKIIKVEIVICKNNTI